MYIDNIKVYRKASKKSQNEVATLLGVTQTQYSRLERGESIINAKQLMILCDLYSCTPNDLFGIHGAMSVAFDPLFEDEKK